MSSDGGKGSGRRPKQISQEEENKRWELVFGKKKPKLGGIKPPPDKSLDSSQEWDEDRIDIVGQNGNVGYDLDQLYQQIEKDYSEGK